MLEEIIKRNMAIIQCKKCNEVFENMRQLNYHICSKEYRSKQWKKTPGSNKKIDEPPLSKIPWRILL